MKKRSDMIPAPVFGARRLRDVIQFAPDMSRRQWVSNFREKIVSILLTMPEKKETKERIFSPWEKDETAEKQLVEQVDPLEKEEPHFEEELAKAEQEEKSHSKAQTEDLLDDLSIGMDYVESTLGTGELVKYLQRNLVDRLIAIGKKVKEEFLFSRFKNITERNNAVLSQNLYAPSKYLHYSDLAHLTLKDYNNPFVSWSSVKQWQKSMKKLERILHMKEVLGVNEKLCQKAYSCPRSSIRYLCDTRTAPLGFLEIAAFVKIFAIHFGVTPKDPLTLSGKDILSFQKLFKKTPKGNVWKWNKKERDAFFENVKTHFPKHAKSFERLLQHFFQQFLEKANEALREGRDDLLEFFPTGSVSKKLAIPLDFEKKEKKVITSRGYLPMPIPSFRYFLSISDTSLKEMVRAYPFIGCWQVQVKDRSDPKAFGDFLNRLSQVSDEGVVLAGTLFVTMLSLEKELQEETLEEWIHRTRVPQYPDEVFQLLHEKLKDQIAAIGCARRRIVEYPEDLDRYRHNEQLIEQRRKFSKHIDLETWHPGIRSQEEFYELPIMQKAFQDTEKIRKRDDAFDKALSPDTPIEVSETVLWKRMMIPGDFHLLQLLKKKISLSSKVVQRRIITEILSPTDGAEIALFLIGKKAKTETTDFLQYCLFKTSSVRLPSHFSDLNALWKGHRTLEEELRKQLKRLPEGISLSSLAHLE